MADAFERAAQPPQESQADDPFSLHLEGEPATYEPSEDACDLGQPEVRDDACNVEAPVAPNALQGIHLYLTSEDKFGHLATRILEHQNVGPGTAGRYILRANAQPDGRVAYFDAYHVERKQNEWAIGPDSIDSFASSAEMYAGTASRLLPGSANVAGSQADGADAVRDPDSVVKQEAFGNAPWQAVEPAAEALNGGGGMLNLARNSHLRLTQYVQPAKELAERLAADVAAGKVDHLDARAQAVNGRNAVLTETRRRQSPAARYASVKFKEQGKTLDEMTAKKVKDNLRAYQVSDATRQVLDADSALWGQYAAAMESGDDVMKSALRDLGQSPEVSRSIIASSGKTNPKFTRIARWGRPAGLALGALGAADMVVDIKDAIEADNWHAAARELGGFAGGVVGGELGAMGAVWIASALIPGGGAGVIIIASLIGGSIGGALGAAGGEGIVDLVAQGATPSGLATPLGAAGGLAGLHSKDGPRTASKQLADAIFATDAELAKYARAIPTARDRNELTALQRKRLEVLARRQHMEDLLTALRLGAFDGPDGPGTSEPEPPPPPPPPQDCDPFDNDCDRDPW